MNRNKKIGSGFEAFFCKQLFFNGFWAHNLAQNQAGQPADVIAARNGKSFLIDCKVCSGGGFPFSRIEDNQETAMVLWNESGNGTGWFALLYEDEIYMVSHSAMALFRRRASSLPGTIIKKQMTLKRWIEEVCK